MALRNLENHVRTFMPTPLPVAIFVAVGLILTIGFEYYYTSISLRWTYSELMPLVPPFGTGLSPLLQWLVIPPVVIWLTRRHLIGSQGEHAWDKDTSCGVARTRHRTTRRTTGLQNKQSQTSTYVLASE
ncbi:hypothetical protein [Roseinatronobacter sp.]